MKVHRVTIAALLALCVFATGTARAQSPEVLRVVLRPATVFVGEGDGPKGFDVELLDMFMTWYGRRQQREIRYEARNVTMVPALLDSVRAGECDLAIGSITITEERDRTVDFSEPYLPLRVAVISRAGALPGGDVERVLRNRTVGAVMGTTHEKMGKELASRIEGLELDVSFETQASLFAALTNPESNVDAAITDITHYWIMSQLNDVVLVSPIGPAQGLGFVLPEGSKLKPSIDAFIHEIRSTHLYFNLIERYFGKDAATMVRASRGTSTP